MDIPVIVFLFVLNCCNGIIALKANDIRNYLGTRTPYRYKYNKNESQIRFSGCKEKKIWMSLRHGTRLPGVKEIEGVNTILMDLKHEILLKNRHKKGFLDKGKLSNLEKWKRINITAEHQKDLTLEGQDEMILTAERIRTRFPNLISKKYDNNTFMFRYTATQRTQQSARYFTIGLFDDKNAQNVIYEPAKRVDIVLRFYKHCDKWQKQVKKNPDTYKEQKLFGISQRMNETLDSISKRLGLDRVLSLDIAELMYKMCGYETSWHKHFESPWCYGFNIDTIKNLEYYHDLKRYWLDGYAYKLTSYQACMLLNHMFQTMSNDNPKATFLFAHSGTVLKLLTHLELYKPKEHLRSESVDDRRAWRTSDIDCFASNLAFVLYKCKDGERLLTLHQERIVKLPMCDEELCPLEHLKKYFHDSIHNCNYEDMCSVTD